MAATIRGEAAVKAKLAEVIAKMAAVAPAAEGAGAQVVARYMGVYAPVDTGDLRGSIGVEGSSAVAAAPHAVFVEKGTRNRPATPFASEAAQASETEVSVAMATVFKAAIRTGV